MTITRHLLVLLAALALVHGAPKKRCCEPSPECNDPCPGAEGDYQSDQMPAADGALYSDQQQGDQQLGAPEQLEGVMEDCCQQGPSCANPCQGQGMAPPMGQPMAPPMGMAPPMAPPMPMAQPMAPPMGMAPPMSMGFGGDCCEPALQPSCQNPCQPAAPPERTAYAPYPGEITFKLLQTWTDKYLDNNSPAFKILSGNVRNAIQAVLGPMASVSNTYFREGYVPGNPATMPKVVAHVMVNGGSDDASRLQMAVTPDGTLGDGLKVYKDSFNAY